MSDEPQATRSLGAVMGRFGDRLNPVLVKEVRQALRGRVFIVSFVLALTLMTTCAPPLGLFFLGKHGYLEHAGNPFWIVMDFESVSATLAWPLVAFAVLAVIANLARIIGGVREVRAAGLKTARG